MFPASGVCVQCLRRDGLDQGVEIGRVLVCKGSKGVLETVTPACLRRAKVSKVGHLARLDGGVVGNLDETQHLLLGEGSVCGKKTKGHDGRSKRGRNGEQHQTLTVVLRPHVIIVMLF